MLKKMMLTAVLAVFMMCGLMGNVMATAPNPDTSMYPESKLNVADLNDKSKYQSVGTVGMNQLVVSYHISVGDVYPKYVSLLWHGKIVVGFTYYDNGIFHVWMKNTQISPLFKKFPIIKKTQEAFKHDFEFVWKDVEFQLLTAS